jgi:hypothetical protein
MVRRPHLSSDHEHRDKREYINEEIKSTGFSDLLRQRENGWVEGSSGSMEILTKSSLNLKLTASGQGSVQSGQCSLGNFDSNQGQPLAPEVSGAHVGSHQRPELRETLQPR